MVQIPQITRDRLASSVVGTPELDTSGQKIGQSMAAMGEQIGQAAGEYAIQRQTLLDQAESNRLIVSKNMADIQAFEQAKNTFASEPEKALPFVQDQMEKNLTSVQQQASNPRVSLMIGANNSYFPSKLGLDVLQWGQLQRVAVDKAHVINQGNQLISQTSDLIDGKKSLTENMSTFTLQAAQAGHISAGAFAAASPASAAQLKMKMLPSLATHSTYKLMQDNPIQAREFLEQPSIKELYKPNPKEWDTLHQHVLQREKDLGIYTQSAEAMKPLIDSPQIVGQIVSPDNAANHIDLNAISAMPSGPMRDALYKLALHSHSQLNQGEQAARVVKFADDAKNIGVDIGKVGQDKSVSDLVKFHSELIDAHADGLINKQTFTKFYGNLAIPLRDAVLKAHDSAMLKQVQNPNPVMGFIQNFFSPHPQPDQVIDKYVGGYDVINNWAKTLHQEGNDEYKAQAIKKYMDVSDSRQPGAVDPLGRPWTPATNARDVMGILEGRDSIQTPIGSRKIAGYNNTTQKPTVDFSPQDQEKLNHLKALQKAMTGA